MRMRVITQSARPRAPAQPSKVHSTAGAPSLSQPGTDPSSGASQPLNKGKFANLASALPDMLIKRIFYFSFKYLLTVTSSVWYSSNCSMKTCLNIATLSWPKMSVPKTFGTRHSRYNQAYVFCPGLSTAAIRQNRNGNMDGPGVSR